jgi:hypothetical protein
MGQSQWVKRLKKSQSHSSVASCATWIIFRDSRAVHDGVMRQNQGHKKATGREVVRNLITLAILLILSSTSFDIPKID